MESCLISQRNGVLKPKPLNNPLAFSFLINPDFLLLHIAHFDNSIALPLLVFKTLEFMFFVFFFHALNNMIALFYF